MVNTSTTINTRVFHVALTCLVVDTGFVKMRNINPVTGFDMLKTSPVSQSQANQRAGRAGRECAGKCFRLYTESTYMELQQFTIPEVQQFSGCDWSFIVHLWSQNGRLFDYYD